MKITSAPVRLQKKVTLGFLLVKFKLSIKKEVGTLPFDFSILKEGLVVRICHHLLHHQVVFFFGLQDPSRNMAKNMFVEHFQGWFQTLKFRAQGELFGANYPRFPRLEYQFMEDIMLEPHVKETKRFASYGSLATTLEKHRAMVREEIEVQKITIRS
ncbi:unnamed protein product [Cuscuta campestris]|uniref:Uncharacterized protein n=1 Tax=Cuscuta campestris TaxID=132261 RepID=A0A484ND61_9ASTE|nr:unnamed protein product [Cuscuta campestris]